MNDQAFLRWAIEQGGLVVAILVILYFYRRDFRASTDEKKEVTTRLFQVVETNTRAMEQLRNSIDDAQNERFPPRRQLP